MNMHSMSPERLLEKAQVQGQECRDCHHDQRVGVGRRYTCTKGNTDHPHAGKATCVNWIPKHRIKQSAMPNGAMQRRG